MMKKFSGKLFVLFLIFSPLLGFAQQNRIDSLLELIKIDKPDTNKVNHLNDLSWILKYQNPDTSIALSNEALKLIEKLPVNYQLKATTLGNLGVYYSLKGDYPDAIHFFLDALKIDKKFGYDKGIARHLGNIGNVYSDQGDYPKALTYYFKALKKSEELGHKSYIAAFLGDIGIVYDGQGDYDKALEYYFKALKIKEELKDKNGIIIWLDNIGNVYDEQSDYPKALNYFLRALKKAEELGNKNYISGLFGDIGIVYVELGDYSKALDYDLKALKMSEELGDKNGIARHLGNIGSIYTKTKRYNKAEKYLLKALKIDKEIGAMNEERQDEKLLSELYEETGRNKLALLHYKKAMALKDTLFNIEKDKEMTRKEMSYQFEKKEAVANAEHKKEMEKQKAIAEEKSRKQKTVIIFVGSGLLLVLMFAGFIFRSLRITQRQKNIIERQKQTVDEKNMQLNRQNDEIRTQRDEIEAQRDMVTAQKEHIEEIHKEVTDSINYAKRIQEAVLPISDKARSILGEHFILFKPKNIVSGDFFWTTKIDNYLIVTVADCTGHGVPGAFMSMLGISFLNEIVRRKEIKQADHVLNELRAGVITALQQSGKSDEQKDGMDISFLVINTETNECQWAGANNPLYIVKSGKLKVKSEENDAIKLYELDKLSNFQLYEVKPDKMPIAIYGRMDKFTNHHIQLQKGDQIYLFSDGFADQFGGPKSKKFMYKSFKELLFANRQKPMNEQQTILNETFLEWKGDNEQVDDVTVVGIKI